MGKVTSKYQLTLPKSIAEHYGIKPGDDVTWVEAGDVIRVIPPTVQMQSQDRAVRLRWFDQATARVRQRASNRSARRPPENRGWRREDLYDRGRSR